MQNLLGIYLILVASMARAEDLPPLEGATFSNIPQAERVLPNGHRHIGVSSVIFSGFGVVGGQQIAPSTDLRASLSYTSSLLLLREMGMEVFSGFAVSEFELSNRIVLSAGVDRLFHITGNPGWGILLGAEAGIVRGQIRWRYRATDTLIKYYSDNHGFIGARIGLGSRETKIGNLYGRMNILIEGLRFRWPKGDDIGPEGHRHNFDDVRNLIVETSLEL